VLAPAQLDVLTDISHAVLRRLSASRPGPAKSVG
jgi:hypothetical protein